MTGGTDTKLIEEFIAGLKSEDKARLDAISQPDAIWSLPGSNLMSGEVTGTSGMLARAATLKRFGVSLEILHVLTGRCGVAVVLHNTGKHDGRVLDEYLTTVAQVKDGRISRLDTYISDIPMLDAYFV